MLSSRQLSLPERRESRFTYRHLAQLALSSTTCPLRVISHIDLDAFYAQCEMVRLGVPEDQPLAVQQWQGLIAINYPARKFGLTRLIAITEAKKLCPDLILQHVATWKEGDEKWAYHKDAAANIGTHKVSLDPYRLESRRIFACIKEVLPPKLQRIEKAGTDEAFLDLSAQVHSILLRRYPELALPAPYDDPTENLPRPPTTALDWHADALVDLNSEGSEEDDPDWDDIAILIGSEVVRNIRATIREKLNYTCSAGIAQNKMLAKLGSAHRKPNQQTVIRNRAAQQFLSQFKFTKIRSLGGKTGEHIVSVFNTDTVTDLLLVSIDQLKQKLGDETGTWVYETIRGIDHSEVNSRMQIKSMLSAKSFSPSINTYEHAIRWLRILVSDIFSRLVEEGVLENKRRPKSINLHHRQGGQTRSRQGPIPQGKPLDETFLFDLARSLLVQIIQEGRVWPCTNLSLSVGSFDDSIAGNMSIGSFLVKGDEARILNSTSREAERSQTRPEKRQRLENSTTGIEKFFPKFDIVEEHDDEFGADKTDDSHLPGELGRPEPGDERLRKDPDIHYNKHVDTASPAKLATHQRPITDYVCDGCSVHFDSREELQDHQDWHFAKDLQAEFRVQDRGTARKEAIATSTKKKTQGQGKKPRGSLSGAEKGQSKLSFG